MGGHFILYVYPRLFLLHSAFCQRPAYSAMFSRRDPGPGRLRKFVFFGGKFQAAGQSRVGGRGGLRKGRGGVATRHHLWVGR